MQTLIFARPLTQEDYEQREGIIQTSDGQQPFLVGDFLMRHRGREYLMSKH